MKVRIALLGALSTILIGAGLAGAVQAPEGGKVTHSGSTSVFWRADGTVYASQARDSGGFITHWYNRRGKQVRVAIADRKPVHRSQVPGPKPGVKRLNVICGSQEYYLLPWRLYNGQSTYYFYNSASSAGAVIYGGSAANNLDAVRAGHVEWNSMLNWCGYGDDTNIFFQFYATTTNTAVGNDGMNNIVWKSDAETTAICGGPATACTIPTGGSVGSPRPWLVDADIVLNRSIVWAVNGNVNGIDLQSIVAHENGHILGLWHTNNRQNVMSGQSPLYGDTTPRKLGNGDVIGIGNYVLVPATMYP